MLYVLSYHLLGGEARRTTRQLTAPLCLRLALPRLMPPAQMLRAGFMVPARCRLGARAQHIAELAFNALARF